MSNGTSTTTYTHTAWFVGLFAMAALFLYAAHQALMMEQTMKLPQEKEEDLVMEEEAQQQQQQEEETQVPSSSCHVEEPSFPRRVTSGCNMSLPLSAVPAF